MSEPFAPLVGTQRAELLGLLADLPPDDWARPVGIGDWSVKDLVSHLVEGELLFGRVYRGELKELTVEDADAQAGVKRWAHADGETVRFSLWHHGSATQRVIDSRSDESWRRALTMFGTGAELRHVLRLHFFDLAVHGRDAALALGTTVPWGDRTPIIVEYAVRNAPAVLQDATLSVDGPFEVHVAGIGAWMIGRDSGSWRLSDPDSAAIATWEPDPDTLVAATTGRLAPAQAVERSNVRGDARAVAELLAAWQLKG